MNINSLIRHFGIQRVIAQKVDMVDRCRQFNVGLLRNMAEEDLGECITQSEVVDALKSMWHTGKILLTKPDNLRFHAAIYSGNEPDDWFFYRNNFNVVMNG